ncbi:flavodoxin family protein [Methanobrevibacter sp. DSM 116169]|uniref:flavodoxin family protein n=1 Tax=Methanobrevibacter sp. DSM 116169 TaxID=3242727 RepID=UPI0038FD2A54
MKVVGICASPRKGGNSEILLDQALKGASSEGIETKKYILNDLDISPCLACETCAEGLDCARNDDMNGVLDELLDADCLIFTSPIYYGQMSAQGKIFVDRLYSISRNPNKSLEGKDAILMFAYGAPQGSYNQYIELTKASPFEYVGMNILGTLDVGDIHDIGEVNSNQKALDEAYDFGLSI